MKTLVTGGAGFVGRHLVERLVREGHEVVGVDLPGPALDELKGCATETVGCDLCTGDLDDCFKGVDTVFHVAAFASPWGPRDRFWSVNVGGTENVLKAAKSSGARRLVMVSSTAAVFDGKTGHDRADESLPYPTVFSHPYPETKSVSERMVLAANCKDLETTAIRPHVIWGPRDKTFLGRLLTHARSGPVYHIGGGDTITDTTYVENLVEGLVLASASDKSPGNVYFITNGEPIRYGELIDRILEIFNMPPARGSIPVPVANLLGSACDLIWSVFKIEREPLLSRYKLAELTYTHTYNLDAARRDLGYKPVVSTEQGFKLLAQWAEAEGMNGGRA